VRIQNIVLMHIKELMQMFQSRFFTSGASGIRSMSFRCVAVITSILPLSAANAWVLNINPGARAVYLAVGAATSNADNTTVNLVSLNLPANAVGTGAAQAMQTNSTQANSPLDNFNVCAPASGQVYIGGFFRLPAASATTAILQVTTPAGLTNGANTIAFNQISWTSTALGNAAADIPAGTFVNGGSLVLRSFAANQYVENCHTFTYANTLIRPAGDYTGVAVYTLTAP
jgi:hypothetical protein